MKVRMTSSGLAVEPEMEITICNRPSTPEYFTGKERRRNDRKCFKTQGYIEKTLERGMIMNVAKSLD